MKAAFYKGTQPGFLGWYNRLIRWWTKSPYSHCELVFSNGLSGSSSFMDDGVRFKYIHFDPTKWDLIDLPDHLESAAKGWFLDHLGEDYDLRGVLHFVWGPARQGKREATCGEALMAALGFNEPWRFTPAAAHAVLSRLSFDKSPATLAAWTR